MSDPVREGTMRDGAVREGGVHGGAVQGLLALELQQAQPPGRAALAMDEAARLAGAVGRDLAALVPDAARLDLVLGGAHFDPAEALRPGWPLHRRLLELHARAPRGDGTPRVFAFGADAAGTVPPPLQADPSLAGGALRVAPFVLVGDAATMDAVGAALEALLFERGMSSADTALLAQEGFDARIEHMRMLSAHDLAALTAMQYAHAGLAPAWQVIEAALFDGAEASLALDAPPEPPLRYGDGSAHLSMLSPSTWRAWDTTLAADTTPERLQHRHALFEARQRQVAAVLQAHGLDVVFDYAG